MFALATLQSQNGFRPPSRRLSRPPSAQRAASRKPDPVEAQHSAAPDLDVDAIVGQNASLLIKGGRKIQSARPADRVSCCRQNLLD